VIRRLYLTCRRVILLSNRFTTDQFGIVRDRERPTSQISGAVTTWPPGHPKGVELHKLQARKRTALISSARFGRRRAFQEDALRGFLQ
jgi:hypothetical protein